MPAGLSKYQLIGFVNISNIEGAREFYGDKLGLNLVSEELPFALVFEANGIMLRLAVGHKHLPLQSTVLGWQVPDAVAAVSELEQAGVTFERFAGLPQDVKGIWTTPTGSKVAWFKDPDGNLLSISEHPEWKR